METFIKPLIIAAACMLFISSQAQASGDCSDAGGNNTCWNFNLGYTIEVSDQGVMENGLEKWSYLVTKKKNASANHILMGLEKDLVVDEDASNETAIFAPCTGDATENVGVGDCLRQYLKWTPNFNTGLYQIILYVEPVGKSDTLPVFVKGSNDIESGTIIGPASATALLVESIFSIDKTQDGRAIAIKMDRQGNIISVETCQADPQAGITCEDYPTDFWPASPDTTATIDLNESYFCIPASPSRFPANQTIDGVEYHCGNVEFKDEGSSIQFKNKGTCRVVSGKLRCY